MKKSKIKWEGSGDSFKSVFEAKPACILGECFDECPCKSSKLVELLYAIHMANVEGDAC